jgi:hypothetical protein
MYGMIHKAARDMACATLGESAWIEVAEECAISSHHLITAAYFDDAVIFRLIAAVARRLGVAEDAALELFGHHWIRFAAESDYARVMAMAGEDLATFIDNLDRMHASIKSTMPEARMPSFRLVAAASDGLDVLYQSERDGMAPFVRGILAALASRYGEDMEIAEEALQDGVLFRLRHRKAE